MQHGPGFTKSYFPAYSPFRTSLNTSFKYITLSSYGFMNQYISLLSQRTKRHSHILNLKTKPEPSINLNKLADCKVINYMNYFHRIVKKILHMERVQRTVLDESSFRPF